MLPKKHRLNQKYFKEVYTSGKKNRGNFGMLVVKNSPNSKSTQFGFVLSKKIGNAVQRHRMTRLLRQITYDILKKYELFDTTFQCQYIAFKYCDNYEELYNEYSKQIIDAFGVTKES
jgi:ribonuclease P protein component